MNKNIIRISQQLLESLLDFKAKNPEFTFALREKDFAGTKKKRLELGCWFQGGDDYIYVPLFSKGDNLRKIKTIGFVVKFQESGGIKENYIEISIKGVKESVDINFHRELARTLGITLNSSCFGYKHYQKQFNYIENLHDYLTRVRPIALKLLEKYNLTEAYLIPEREFATRLAVVRTIQTNLTDSR